MNNCGDVSWQEVKSYDEDCPLATYFSNDGVDDSNSHQVTLLVNGTENDEYNVIDYDVWQQWKRLYYKGRKWQRRNNYPEKD